MQALLDLDFKVSSKIYQSCSISHKVWHFVGYTGEGYFWVIGSIPIAMYMRSIGSTVGELLWANVFLINVIDLVFIAVSKFTFKRPRPMYEQSNKTATYVYLLLIIKTFHFVKLCISEHKNKKNRFIGPDVHSFPSGHTSRAWAVAYIFCQYLSGPAVCPLALLMAFANSFSRILLGRHYLGDIIGGCALAALTVGTYKMIGPVNSVSELIPGNSNFLLSRMLF